MWPAWDGTHHARIAHAPRGRRRPCRDRRRTTYHKDRTAIAVTAPEENTKE